MSDSSSSLATRAPLVFAHARFVALQSRGAGVLNKELPQLEAELGPLFERVC